MARDSSSEVPGTPGPDQPANKETPQQPTGEKSMATLDQLRVRMRLNVFHKASNEYHIAEIISIAERKGKQYYVHYQGFNKRLDEWVTADRLDLTREVEWPLPEPAVKEKKAGKASKSEPSRSLKRPRGRSDSRAQKAPKKAKKTLPAAKAARSESVEFGRDSIEPEEDEEVDEEIDEEEVDLEGAKGSRQAKTKNGREPAGFSKESEIEKLRTSGSMTQSAHEIARVRNLSKLQLGRHLVEPWYFSPYPQEFTHAEMVYICEFCLRYFDDEHRFRQHRYNCTLYHPPGNEIYRDEEVSFFEIDGRRQRVYCRNLCLLSKCFLDHKTLYYDVDPFLFYCMTKRDERGHHLIGYFSKEKESAEGYNVACILTLPQYQRHGYGKLLIAFSYELSRREGKQGSPEKPLSDLGLLSYRAYWQDTILESLERALNASVGTSDTPTVEDLAAESAMTTPDVIHTLQNLHMIRYRKTGYYISMPRAVKAQREAQRKKLEEKGLKPRQIIPENLNWKPPTFIGAAKTWNW